MKRCKFNFSGNSIKKYLLTILICSAFPLHASEQPDYNSGDKRLFLEKEIGEGPASKRPRKDKLSSGAFQETSVASSSQIYSIPTYDATFKYMLSDPKICLSFLRTFSLNPDIEAIEKLDEHLRPVQSYQMAQFIINDKKSKKLMEKIDQLRKEGEEIDVVTTDSRSITNGGWFLTSLSEIYGDILSAFPTPERNSTVDVLCRLHDGSYTLVEVQVVEQDYWDRRALAYAASVYSQQMRRSDKWEKLKSVICINILGGGSKSVTWDTIRTFKHYKFKDQENDSIDGGIEILQYPLYHSATIEEASREAADDDQRIALREWMDFLEHASKKKADDMLLVRTEEVKEAYEKVKAQNLPKEVVEANERQDEEIFKRSERVIEQKTQKAREEGRQEGEQIGIAKGEKKLEEEKRQMAKMMSHEGMDTEVISKITGLSVEDIRSFLSGSQK